jgi:hypothetical protein
MPGGPTDFSPDSASAAIRRARLVRFALTALAIAVLLDAAWLCGTVAVEMVRDHGPSIGNDFSIYVERTQSWLAGDGFYRARQLTGPYSLELGDALYPPPAVLLFLPWALGAPPFLWWLIPLATAIVSLARLKPPSWTWFLLLAIFVFIPRAWVAITLGNPSIWVFAAILAGWAFRWPAVVVFLKPALAPFALVGARWASWWRAVGVTALLSVLFAPMWSDYARVLLDLRNSYGPDYLMGEIPIALALSVIGYAGYRSGSAKLVSTPAPEPVLAPAHGAAHAPSRAIAWK